MKRYRLLLGVLLFAVGSAFVLQDTTEQAQSDSGQPGSVSIISVSGTIGPTTTQYIKRGLKASRERGDELLVIELDTPGGLLTSTQEIVQELLGSSHPIAVFVSPEGANAGSAGTFITLAAHIAAMAPATNIGAASPVSMGGAEMDFTLHTQPI